MHVERRVGAGHVAARVVEHGHHNVADAVILERNIEGDVHPVASTYVGEVHRAIEYLEHLIHWNPVVATGKRTLVGVAHINHNVFALRRTIYILEGDTVDGPVDSAKICCGVELLTEGVFVEGVQREQIACAERSSVLHNHRVLTIGAGIRFHHDRHRNRIGLATGSV